MNQCEFKNCIIHLIGFAGVGKLTSAREIVSKSNMKLVDNHLINNPILSLIKADGKTPLPAIVWEKVEKIRDVIFDTIINVSPADYSFVFTNELTEGKDNDLKLYKKVERLAAKRGSTYLPVRLICEEEELCKRVVSEERKLNFKEIDIISARQKSRTASVFSPGHPNTFTLDVTNLSASKAADIILAKLKSLNQ